MYSIFIAKHFKIRWTEEVIYGTSNQVNKLQ